MNIRRFTAPDMRGALAAIRAELGADAATLSSRRLADGVEVIAAIDYDDSLLATFGGQDARDGEQAREPAVSANATGAAGAAGAMRATAAAGAMSATGAAGAMSAPGAAGTPAASVAPAAAS